MKTSIPLIISLITGVLAFIVISILNDKIGLAVGSVFVLFGLGITYENLSARFRWKRTKGTITELNFKKERISFVYEVDGVQYAGESGHDPNYCKVGNPIDIHYDPAKPEISHHVSSMGDLLGLSLIILGFGTLALETI